MNDLKNIVDISIDIQNPSPPVGFGECLLIVGLPPVIDPAKPISAVGEYQSYKRVLDVGFAADDPVAIAARIAFMQSPKPRSLFIAVRQEGASVALEPIKDTLDRANDVGGWYAVCPAGIGVEDFDDIAKWTEQQEKIFAYTYLSKDDPLTATYNRAIGWCGLLRDDSDQNQLPEECSYAHVAAVAKCLSFVAGSESWAYKAVNGMPPFALSSELRNGIAEAKSNAFINVSSKNYTVNGMTRIGEWIDVIRGRDWLTTEIRQRIFSLMAKEPKIAFLDGGLVKIQNELTACLKAAQERSIIELDTFDDDDNEVPGFVINIPRMADITPHQRASRKLSGCTFTAKLAGAIHAVEVHGTLTY